MTTVIYKPNHSPAKLKQGWREYSPLYNKGNALGPYVIWKNDGQFEIHATQISIIASKHDNLADAQKHLKELYRAWQAATVDYVYFIGSELAIGAMVKIGTTRNTKRRLSQIQSNSPLSVKILAVTEGDANTEYNYHARFAGSKSHGEWFNINAEILREIKRINKLALLRKTL